MALLARDVDAHAYGFRLVMGYSKRAYPSYPGYGATLPQPLVQLCELERPLRVHSGPTPERSFLKVSVSDPGTLRFLRALDDAVLRAARAHSAEWFGQTLGAAEVRAKYRSPAQQGTAGTLVTLRLKSLLTPTELHRMGASGIVHKHGARREDLVPRAGVVPLVCVDAVWFYGHVKFGVGLRVEKAVVYPQEAARLRFDVATRALRVDAGCVYEGEEARIRPALPDDLEGTYLAWLPPEVLQLVAFPALCEGLGRSFCRGATTPTTVEYAEAADPWLDAIGEFVVDE